MATAETEDDAGAAQSAGKGAGVDMLPFAVIASLVLGPTILFAINPITDRFSTIGNVAADMAVTAIVGRSNPKIRP